METQKSVNNVIFKVERPDSKGKHIKFSYIYEIFVILFISVKR